jgi:hypothetical protein
MNIFRDTAQAAVDLLPASAPQWAEAAVVAGSIVGVVVAIVLVATAIGLAITGGQHESD